MFSSRRFVGLLLPIILSFPIESLCQGERATVTGAVTDPTGKIVVGADVAIRNIGTNIFSRTKTNAAGIYYLPAYNPDNMNSASSIAVFVHLSFRTYR